MIDVVGLGGEPASGKSTLATILIDSFEGPQEDFDHGLVKGHYFPEEKVVVLGLYDGENDFNGTDRLSMAVMPEAQDFLDEAQDLFGEESLTIFFEGDRLFSNKFIDHCMNHDKTSQTKWVILLIDEQVADFRHKDRDDDQSDKFISGRRTKYHRILERWDIAQSVEKLENNTSEDQETNLEFLQNLIRRKQP